MDKKRWIVSSIVVTVVLSAMEAIIQPLFFGKIYEATVSLWRSYDVMSKMLPYGWIATLVMVFVLVYVFHRGYEGRPNKAVEGLRFGLIIGILTSVPMSVWTYIMMPIPLSLAVGWFLTGMLDMLVAGVLISLMYKRTAA